MGEKTFQELSKIIGNLEFSFIDFFFEGQGETLLGGRNALLTLLIFKILQRV
jgi:hypothetical protein